MLTREIKIGLFNEKNQTSFTTEQVIGYLNSIIIETDTKLEIVIESESGYMLFHRKEVYGTEYFCPRQRITTPEQNLLDYLDYDKFLLNEKIIVTIIGPKKATANVIIRID